MYSPNASPTIPSASALFSPVPNSPQSHPGYSPSSFANGASCPLINPNPFSGVPAGTLLLGILSDAEALSLGGIVGVLEGEGVKGVEKGWALDVDVAGGGDSGNAPVKVVEIARMEEVRTNLRDRRRVQRWQIIVNCSSRNLVSSTQYWELKINDTLGLICASADQGLA